MAVSFATLPNETLIHIISNVHHKQDLCKLARCSHQIQTLVLPQLYSHATFEGTFWKQAQNTELFNFTCLMLKKSQIASYVRAITLSGGYRNESFVVDDDAEHREAVDEALEMAVKAASNCEEEERDWLENLRHDDEYAAIALLLPALVRLEKLDLMVRVDSLYLDTMLQRASVRQKPFDTPLAFDALTEVTFSSWEHNNPGVLARFFKLPSVRKIYSLVLGRDKADEDQPNPILALLEPGSSSVEHLELNSNNSSLRNIEGMLRASKSPKTFIYELVLGSVSLPNFNNTELRRALEPARSTLENLCITYAAE